MLAAALAFGADPQQPGPAGGGQPGVPAGQQGAAHQGAVTGLHVDGTWTVLCAEENGQKLNTGQNQTVTIRGNVITWQKDGKEHHARLLFGPNHMLTCLPEKTGQEGKTQGQASTPGHPRVGTPERQGQTGTPAPGAKAEGQKGQPGTAQAGAGQPGAEPGQTPQIPNRGPLPGQVGYLPPVPGRDNIGAGAPGTGVHAMGSHHGVYIFADNFLCLTFDAGFPGMHERMTPGAAKAGKGQGAGQHPGTTVPNQQAGAGQPGQPVVTTPGRTSGPPVPGQVTAQAPAGGQTRTANYPREGQHAGAGMSQQGGFVLILRRAGGQ
jgi:hypothetical protein